MEVSWKNTFQKKIETNKLSDVIHFMENYTQNRKKY